MEPNFLSDNWMIRGNTYKDFINNTRELADSTTCLIHNNNICIMNINLEKTNKEYIYGTLIMGETYSNLRPVKVSIKEYNITDEFFEDIKKTPTIIFITGENGHIFFIAERAIIDLGKVASVNGNSIKEPSIERDVFLKKALMQKINKNNMYIIRSYNKLEKIFAINSDKTALDDTTIILDIANKIKENFDIEDYKWSINHKISCLYMIGSETNGYYPTIQIIDSGLGESSLKFSCGIFTLDKEKYINLYEYSYKHGSNQIKLETLEKDIFEIIKYIKNFNENILTNENKLINDEINKKINIIWKKKGMNNKRAPKELRESIISDKISKTGDTFIKLLKKILKEIEKCPNEYCNGYEIQAMSMERELGIQLKEIIELI